MSALADLPVIGTLLPFLIVLGAVVTIHELGHYYAARWRGVHAEVFSVGFGPSLWSRRDRRGTLWQVAAVPLGGYVKFLGDADAASATTNHETARDPRSFPAASLGARALIVAAGPIANFVLAILIFAGLAMWSGVPDPRPVIGELQPDSPAAASRLESGDVILQVGETPVDSFADMLSALRQHEGQQVTLLLQRGERRLSATITYVQPPRVDAVMRNTPAERAGLQAGDVLLSINGQAVTGFGDVARLVRASQGRDLAVMLRRAGQVQTLTLTPEWREARNPDGSIERRPMIGIRSFSGYGILPRLQPVDPLRALWIGVERSYGVIAMTVDFIGEIFAGRESAGELGGPIQIAGASAQAADAGVVALLALIAFLSVSIGFMNLLPVPVLDGGHLLFYAIEWVRGRSLGDRWMNALMGAGMMLLLSLMLFATFNDLTRL